MNKRMKLINILILAAAVPLLCSFRWFWETEEEKVPSEISSLSLDGHLEKGNLVFDLNVSMKAGNNGIPLELLSGEVVLIEHTLGQQGKLVNVDGSYFAVFEKKADVNFKVTFAVKKNLKNGQYFGGFKIPDFQIRKMSFNGGQDQIDYKFHSLLKVDEKKSESGDRIYEGFLTLGNDFSMSWKPKVVKLEKELSLICQVHSVANIGVGNLKLSSLFDYRVVQGYASQLQIKIPQNLSITRVVNSNIRDWQLIKKEAQSILEINLKKQVSGQLTLLVEGESAIKEFPAKAALEIPEPLDVIRASGFLAVGTDSAIKLLVDKTEGVTQVESISFQKQYRAAFSSFPKRSSFVYNFASLPVSLELSADKVQPVLYADNQLIYRIRETEMQLSSRLELDVRDSTIREVELQISKELNVSDVRAADLNGFETVEAESGKVLKLYFRNAFIGKKLIDISLEWSHKGWQGGEVLPSLKIANARTYRGFVSISSDEGLLTDLTDFTSLRKIPVASLPLRGKDISSAWRFKDGDWNAKLSVKKKKTAIYSELFHLYSLGENVVYGSVSLTYHVSGAPVDSFKFKIPDYCKNVEFTSRFRPRTYKIDDGSTEVKIQKKISGDFNLLVTFEIPTDTQKGLFTAGGIETIGTDSETGFISVTGSDGLKMTASESQGSILQIDPDQVPAAYRLLQSHPVHLAFKYVKVPHSSQVNIESYDRVSLLDQVIEHSSFKTRVSVNGERITEVTCWLKNSNHQHFKLSLPENSNLWKAKVDGRTVRCTTQAEQLQIPIPINSDPNKTIKVEFTYAEKGDALSEGLTLNVKSPSFSVPSIYNEWNLNMPGGFLVSKNDGSMELFREKSLNERTDILSLVTYFVTQSLKYNANYVIIFFIGLVIFSVCWIIPQTRIFGSICGIILVGWGIVNLLNSVHVPVLNTSQPAYEVMDFKKTVSAANEVQVISGLVHDNSVVHTGQSKVNFLLLILASALVVASYWWRNFVLPFAALICAWFACRGSYEAEYYFAIGISILLPVSLAVFIARIISAGRIGKSLNKNKTAVTAVLALALFLPDLRAESKLKAPEPLTLVDSVSYVVNAKEKTAVIDAEIKLTGKAGQKFTLLKSPCALLSTEYVKENLKLAVNNGNCMFTLVKKGSETVKIKFEVPLHITGEERSFSFYKPDALTNKSTFYSSKENQEVKSHSAVYLATFEEALKSSAVGIFKNGEDVSFSWNPAEKKVTDIKPVYFSETQSLAVTSEGHIDIQHIVSLQVARGQISRLMLKIPSSQNVTSVVGEAVVNWAFDPKTKNIEVLLKNTGKDKMVLGVSTQIPTAKLPYKADLEVPQIIGASRQHGLIALAGSEGVKVNIANKKELQGIDPVDFELSRFNLSAKKGPDAILFPFRYFKYPVKVALNTEKVLPELEVTDHSSFSIGDERYVLNAKLNIHIKKAGVFEVKMKIPADYEIETLSVNGISHWDEISKNGEKFAILYFKNRVKGDVPVNAVLIKNAEKVSGDLSIPGIEIVEEKKHRGSLIISAELGNRLEVKTKNGVGGMLLVKDGVMTFSILRQNWDLTLSREVLSPRIEVEYLQSVGVSDNRYNVALKARVKIENAGTKFLTLTAPADVQNLEIRGRDIAKTEKLSDSQWRVEFKRKLIGEHDLHLQYQAFYDPSQGLNLSGLKFVEAARQRGYLCLFIPSYMTGKVSEENPAIKAFESRLLPASLSSAKDRQAVYCYRILTDEWSFNLQFIKHSKASVLEATVSGVTIETMVSRDGRQLHVVSMRISGGSKNFLNMQLPAGSSLSSVFADGEPLQTTIKDSVYLIPLNQSVPGEKERTLQITYIQDVKSFAWKAAAFSGPQFDLPLKDINWFVYVPKEKVYDKFTGSMKYIPEYVSLSNSTQEYLSQNKQGAKLTRDKANDLLQQGYEYSNIGRRDLARKTFESVLNLSESMDDINEDARVQLQETLRQQTLVGLVNRRANLKTSISGESNDFDDRKYNGGFFSDSFAKQVEKTLETEDNQILGTMSDKIMNQQKAALQKVLPLKLILPKEGRRIHFFREVQIEPLTPMTVNFTTKEEKVEIKELNPKTRNNILLFGIMAFVSVFFFGVNFKFKKPVK